MGGVLEWVEGANREGAPPTARLPDRRADGATSRQRADGAYSKWRANGANSEHADCAGDVAGGTDLDLGRARRFVLDIDTDIGRCETPKTDHASAPPSTSTSITKSKTIPGVYGNGSSITGGTGGGAGTNTGQGIAVPGTLDTPGATSTTVVGGDAPTTRQPGSIPTSRR